MGMTTALVLSAIATAAVGTYSAIDANKAAKANEKTQANAMEAQAMAAGRAAAESNELERTAGNATAATAKNPELDGALSIKKRGVNSSFTATTGSGAGMMKGTTLSPLGED